MWCWVWNLNSPKCIFQGTTPQHVCYRRGNRKRGRSPNLGLHSWVSERRGDLITNCSSVPNPQTAGQPPVRQPFKLDHGNITSGASHRVLSLGASRFRDTGVLPRLGYLSKQTVSFKGNSVIADRLVGCLYSLTESSETCLVLQ